MLLRISSWLDRLAPRAVFLLVFLPLFAIYFSTASRGLPYHIDTMTNALTAWHIAARGTVYADESPNLTTPESYGNIAWYVKTNTGHVVSQYPPGTALIAAPFYLFDTSFRSIPLGGNNDPDAPKVPVDVPSMVPAALAASAATAAAMALLALVFLQFLSPSATVGAAYVAGLGTGAWAVASNGLWQHGPAMFWIALALLLTARKHLLGAGLAFGMAVLTRPHTALIAAGLGLAISIARRSVKPAVQIGIGSGLGLAALLGFNWAVFGSVTISGGYGSVFADQALSGNWWWYLRNVAGALFDPSHGLLFWTPFLIILIPGLVKAWKVAPPWARGAAIGGLLYLLLQLKANRFSGGDGHFAYRYPLEMLAAAAPLLALSWREWVKGHALRTKLLAAAVVLSVVGQTIGAILY